MVPNATKAVVDSSGIEVAENTTVADWTHETVATNASAARIVGFIGFEQNSEIEPRCGLTVMAHRGKCGANPSLRGRLRPWVVHSAIMTRNAALAKGKLRDGGGIHGMGLSKQLSEGSGISSLLTGGHDQI